MTEPRILKGFRDTLPTQELVREHLLTRARECFRHHGFQPIDTPTLEYSEVLLGKGGAESDKQLYRFTDHGGRDVALRYDLTVPLARFTAQHYHELRFPLRRYQIGKVFRGEKPQRGRFREFIQCDFDTLGSDNIISDYDTLQLPLTLLSTIIPAGKLQLRISHRDLLINAIHALGTKGETAEMRAHIIEMRTIIDKLHAIGSERVRTELTTLLPHTATKQLESLMGIIQQEIRTPDPQAFRAAGLHDPTPHLPPLLSLLRTHHPEVDVLIDPSIMRGLSYYTGVIFEIYHREQMKIGAISSGGRYDGLVGRYRGESLSAVGGSLGIDRLLSIPGLAETTERGAGARVLVFHERGTPPMELLQIAHSLRARGTPTEVYPQPAKLQRQFGYAEEKKIKFGIIVVQEMGNTVHYEIKNLHTKERVVCLTLDALLQHFG